MSDLDEEEFDWPENSEDEFEEYKDSYVQRERATHGVDEGWKEIGGQTYLGDHPGYIAPDQVFRNEITMILQTDAFELDTRDKQVITQMLDTLHWKLLKVPSLYVAGYYLKKKKYSKQALAHIQRVLPSLENFTALPFEPIKYARYWETILL